MATKKRSVFSKRAMSIERIFPRLNSLESGFLREDSIIFAKENGMRNKGLVGLPGRELRNLSMIQKHVLPASLKRIETKQKKERRRFEIDIEFRILCRPESH